MIRPDIVVAWPRNCDYPLWRQFIRDNRERFNLVIIVFTETNQGEDYREFIKQAMHQDYVLCIDNPQIRGDEDWRDVAIHQALIHSYNAEWIWFTEQDFIPKEGFWEQADKAADEGYEVLATYDHGRMHPCNIFIKREALMRTRKRFGIVPDVSDHFSLFQKELEENGTKIWRFPDETFEHLNGLSHNMTLVYNGGQPNWNAERFERYITDCFTNSNALMDSRWVNLFSPFIKA